MSSNSLTQSRYRAWDGVARSPWWSCLPMIRVALSLLCRRWVFWGLMALGLMNFLFNFALIYMKAVLSEQNPEIARIVDAYQVTGTGQAYLDFMFAQSAIVTLLLAFAGSTLIGSDYRHGGQVFYLSRRIHRRHYIAGKLTAISAVVLLITFLPAVVLFAQYGLMSTPIAYFRENYRILLGITGYALVLAVVQSFLLFAIAACVPRTVPLAMTWLGSIVLLQALADALRSINGNRKWMLLSLGDCMYRVGRWCFGFGDLPGASPRLALLVLAGICLACGGVILWRVRAVEVVK